jgi:O-antigen ligase
VTSAALTISRPGKGRIPRPADRQGLALARWPLYILAFSLPLEYPDRFAYEVTTMTSALVVLTALIQPRMAFSRFPWALAWFAVFVYAMLVSMVTQGTRYPGGLYLNEVWALFQFILLRLVVFWISYNLLRNDRIRTATMWALVLGCLVRAALPVLGLARTVSVLASGGERVTIWGQSANQSAQVLALGLLALIGLVYLQRSGRRGAGVLAWGAAALLMVGMVQTGSRGGLLTLCVGLLVICSAGRTVRVRIRRVAVASVALTILLLVSIRSDMMRGRVELASEGDFAGRENIYPSLVDMFRDKPVLGWGPVTNKYELAQRLGVSSKAQKDAHNIVLEILTAAGLLGGIPFFVGVWLCLQSAWIARDGREGILPLAMLLAVLAGNMTQNRLAGALLWLILAYALASISVPTAGSAVLPTAPRPKTTARLDSILAHPLRFRKWFHHHLPRP